MDIALAVPLRLGVGCAANGSAKQQDSNSGNTLVHGHLPIPFRACKSWMPTAVNQFSLTGQVFTRAPHAVDRHTTAGSFAANTVAGTDRTLTVGRTTSPIFPRQRLERLS